MKQLYLLRHAESEPWNPLGNDFSRKLSEIGVRDAQTVSEWAIETLPVPDTVLCSPAKRTRQTLAPFLTHWPQLLSVTDYVDSMYGASLNMLCTLMEDAFSYSERLLMVGHNPGFEGLLISPEHWPSLSFPVNSNGMPMTENCYTGRDVKTFNHILFQFIS